MLEMKSQLGTVISEINLPMIKLININLPKSANMAEIAFFCSILNFIRQKHYKSVNLKNKLYKSKIYISIK